jgi:putative transposase
LKDLDKSYQNFFRGLKKKTSVGFPKFKSKHKARLSYRITMSIDIVDDYHISIPKVGVLKARHGFIAPTNNRLKDLTKIVNATISKSRSGKYFISLACEVAVKPKQSTSKKVGIDLGIKNLVTLSEESNPIPNPKHLQKYLSKLAKEQKILARRVKGSNNRAKQKLKVARLHEKITNARRDYLNKVSLYLVNTYDVIVMEDLDVRSMLEDEENKDPRYNMTRNISDASFAELKRQLEYKCEWYGKQLLKVNRYYPSSKTCSNCGEIKDHLERGVSIYECEACGLEIDRDKNASINILTVGMTGLA